MLLREGELPQARKAYEDGLLISKTLAEKAPSNVQAQRDLSISYERLGDLLVSETELPQARKAYKDGLRIRKTLAEKDPSNAQAQRDLSISFNKMGDLLVREGELPQARIAFEDGLRIRKTLAEKEPTNAQAQSDLAWSHWQLLRTAGADESFAKQQRAAYSAVVDAMAQKVVHFWKRGDLQDAFSRTTQLVQFPMSTSGSIDALLWGLARQQYHGFRELFDVRFPFLKTEYRPVYFALLRLMKDEDPDSYRRMGKELEEPVQQILARVEQIRKELGAPATRTTRKADKSAPKKSAKRTGGSRQAPKRF
jgi:tetratricopeptide (TPR) repeat protein